VSVVYGTTANVAGAAIRNVRIGPGRPIRIFAGPYSTGNSRITYVALAVNSISPYCCRNLQTSRIVPGTYL